MFNCMILLEKYQKPIVGMEGKGGKGREGKGREGKGWEGEGREEEGIVKVIVTVV